MKVFPILAAAAALFAVAPGTASASVAVSPSAPLISTVAASAVAQTSVRISVGDQRRGYRRHHSSRRAYWRRSCRSTWRHGRRFQNCRRVRYWR